MAHVLAGSTPNAALSRAKAVLERLFPPPRAFGVRLWDGTELPADHSAFSLVLNHPGALRRMFTPPIELALGEAFVCGDFDIEGDLFAVFALLDEFAHPAVSPGSTLALARQLLMLPKAGPRRPAGRGPVRLRGARHSRERDRVAVRYHYDVGNAFYRLWLDRRLQYSCAYFPTGTEDLDTAQERKLEHLCRKLRLKPGERLLDIGCGWGGLAQYAAERFDAEVVGVTLSQNQAEYARQAVERRGLRGVSIRLQDYRDLAAESFDKIVSVGMFEHVGRAYLPEYFAQAYRLLRPGGLFLNHGIARRVPAAAEGARSWQRLVSQRVLGAGSFVSRYVFPDGELVPVSEGNLLAEQAGFEVRDVENLREHYTLTLRHWVTRLEARQAEAIQASDEVTYRTWCLYMAGSAHAFETGRIAVNQSLLSKPDAGRSRLPLTRADLYTEAVDQPQG